MHRGLALALILVAAGCGDSGTTVVVAATPMRLEWAGLLGKVQPAERPAAEAAIRRDAAATGAKVLDVTMLTS